MSQSKKPSQPPPVDQPGAHASQGNTSPSVTPKDVQAGEAAARDVHERHLDSPDPEERQQEQLDDAIELSFPASDPPSVGGGVTRIEKPAGQKPASHRPSR